MLKRQHQLFVSLMCVADAVVIGAACYAAWGVRRVVNEGFFPRSWENWTIKEPLVVFAVPIGLLALGWFGLYRARRDRSLRTEWWQVFRASLLVTATTLVLVWLVGNDALISGDSHYTVPVIAGIRFHPGRVQFGCLAIALPLVLASHRTAIRFVLRAVRRRGYNLRHVAVVGVGRLGQIVARTLDRNSWTGLHVNYFVSHHPQTRRTTCLARPVLGGLDELERALRDRPVDAVYIALPNAVGAALPGVLQRLEKFALDVRIIPDVHPRFVAQSMVVNELDGMPVLSYRENLSTGLGGATKRALDLAGAAAALALFAPIMALVWALIRLTSPGPVIFKQQRVSIGARTFRIYKFRTMYHVEDEQAGAAGGRAAWTSRNDPRVTPVGRWLRRTSLDELPQLINVIRGDMSLVGPRPERPELIEQFRENWRGYLLRQHVKAGMTGWAQVNGHRGDTGVRKRLQYDLFYIKHWSLAFDLRILWLTVFRGFVHRNAH